MGLNRKLEPKATDCCPVPPPGPQTMIPAGNRSCGFGRGISPSCFTRVLMDPLNEPQSSGLLLIIFFHEYGRRVGMVPRSSLKDFVPRVRTPCGHGAQVIIEGREIQSDGGEKDKENPTTNQPNQTTANQSPQAESPPSCSLSSVLR